MTTQRRPDSSRRRRDDGYTLVEILVVLAIIALLVALVAPRMLGRVGQARGQSTETQIENLLSALELYQLDTGNFPDPNDGLSALVVAPEGANGWAGPYLRTGVLPTDPWNRAYLYSREDGEVRITSFGRDGIEGGDGEDADITRQLIE